MSDASEILELFEKIDGMASENNHSCYRGSTNNKDKEQISNVDSQYFKDKENSAGKFAFTRETIAAWFLHDQLHISGYSYNNEFILECTLYTKYILNEMITRLQQD